MPVYRAAHECGYTNEVFLRGDKDTIVLKCSRCSRQVTAHQVRDRTVEFKGNNEVTGVFQHEQQTTKT